MSIIVSINISERKKDRKRKIEKLGQRKKLEKLADREIKIEIKIVQESKNHDRKRKEEE